jgi:uncharacterized protein (DUF58 family)
LDISELTFPLVPRSRLIGTPFGGLASYRRGQGADVAGSRLYRPGDDMDLIDWASSARLSAARGSDEFVVREHFAEEAPRVVVVADRRPAMALYPPGLPFLSKPDALRVAIALIHESTLAERGFLGYLDYADGAGGDPFWLPPRGRGELWELEARDELERPFAAPDDNVTLALEYLARLRGALPPGSFVFVLSDFLAPPTGEAWLAALEHRWDVVPVVIQDPTWERSFPLLPPVALPVADPATGSVAPALLTRAEMRARRAAHERRLAELLDDLGALALEPILLDSADPRAIHDCFLAWAEQRLLGGAD